jgi:hypothetical protein
MKVVSFILSIFILILSVTVYSTNDNCNDDVKTEQTSNHHTSQENHNHCSDNCSPFLICNTCLGFINNAQFINIEPSFFLIEEKHSAFNSNRITTFCTSFWQPPKVC